MAPRTQVSLLSFVLLLLVATLPARADPVTVRFTAFPDPKDPVTSQAVSRLLHL